MYQSMSAVPLVRMVATLLLPDQLSRCLQSPHMADDGAQLLTRAAQGDRVAWDQLVDRYGRLVWSIARSFGLDDATAGDVSQTVWLRLVEHCANIRDPDRLPGWLATTTRREALRVLRNRRRQQPSELTQTAADPTAPLPDELLLDDELSRTVAAAYRQLPERCRQLLRLLCVVPRLDYQTISGVIDRPVGSIGPTRARCLERLRHLMESPRTGAQPSG